MGVLTVVPARKYPYFLPQNPPRKGTANPLSMTTSLADLTAMLADKFDPSIIESEKILTSYRKTRGWLKGRVKRNQQLLINAIACSRNELVGRMETLVRDIKTEFGSTTPVHPLPYPYDQVDLMLEHIDQLIAKYGGSFNAKDVVIEYQPNKEDTSGMEGYLILTIIDSPVIVSQ